MQRPLANSPMNNLDIRHVLLTFFFLIDLKYDANQI